MIMRVWDQLTRAGLKDSSLVCASQGQHEIIRSQLGGVVPVALEPSRRDTFPAVALSCAYLKSVMGASDEDVAVFLPVDPYTDAQYFETLKSLPDVLAQSGAEAALMGVVPREPSSGFGYIVPGADAGEYRMVDSFREKPDEDTARALIDQGALWNCGVFCVRVGDILKRLEKYGVSTEYNALYEQYDKLPARSFDYEYLEHARTLAVRSFDGEWKDLGTWSAMSDMMHGATIGDVRMDARCENTHIISELDIPVVAIGLRNMVIVAAQDGILVSDKQLSAAVKDVAADIDRPPMIEERRWGVYTTLDHSARDGVYTLTRKLTMLEGLSGSYHSHAAHDEVWMITHGAAEVNVEGSLHTLKVGECITIRRGERHALHALEPLELIEVSTGEALPNEDARRESYAWADIPVISDGR